jgi:YfiH family protein
MSFFIPDWPAPDNVRSAITLRTGGCSKAPFNENNIALHVGDTKADVLANRDALKTMLNLPQTPVWLDQVHGTEVIYAPDARGVPSADGSYSDQARVPCAVMSADCLPVLLCDHSGTQVAAVHAGWRGLASGILRKTVSQFSATKNILVYLGPAIGHQAFEVGVDVRDAFLSNAQNRVQQDAIKSAFSRSKAKYLADIYALARAELEACGVSAVYGGEFCTVNDSQRFFSYRRDGETGRNASLIWFDGV